MPERKDLDPMKMLSLVEGEVLGDRLPDFADADVEAREGLLALIRSNPVERERYAQLKLGVTALCEMPKLDAPKAVWEHLDAHFEEALEGRPATQTPQIAGKLAGVLTGRIAWRISGRIRGIGRDPVLLRRVRRLAVAAACLLVLVVGLWIARGLGPSSPTEPRVPGSPNGVIFVRGKPTSSAVTAQVVIGEFFAKVPKRIQGVSPEAVKRLLGTPSTED